MTAGPCISGSPRVVLSNFGSAGDINPLIALASRLKAHGYRPVLAASAKFRDRIEREHIGFAAIGPDLPEIIRGVGSTEREAASAENDFAFVLKTMVMPHIEQSFADAMEAIADAALVIAGPLAFGARLAAIKHRVPWLSLSLQPTVFLPSWWRTAENYLGPEQELRIRLGLSRHSGDRSWDGIFSPLGTIALYSPLLPTDDVELPPRTEAVGFAFYDRTPSGQDGLSASLNRFLESGPPPLVFTAGSWLAPSARAFFQHGAMAARALKRRAVLLTGVHREGTMLADGVFACPYTPFSHLLSRVEAVVHHGGIGTLAQALSAGRPQLVVPFGFDQYDNAERLVRLGVARQLSATRYTAQTAAEQLNELLSANSYKERATDLARLIREEDGAGKVLRIVDEVLQAR